MEESQRGHLKFSEAEEVVAAAAVVTVVVLPEEEEDGEGEGEGEGEASKIPPLMVIFLSPPISPAPPPNSS